VLVLNFPLRRTGPQGYRVHGGSRSAGEMNIEYFHSSYCHADVIVLYMPISAICHLHNGGLVFDVAIRAKWCRRLAVNDRDS
jgi:hypothetical protein